MAYIKPTHDNINFELFSGYIPPEAHEVFFDLTPSGTIPPEITYFEGSAFEASTALSGSTLHLYKRSTGELISSTVTTVSGTFGLPYIETDEYYFIVSLYPSTKYNALIYDYIYPTVSGGSA